MINERLNRVIHKSLRDFRPLRYSSRDVHAGGEHVNRGRNTPSLLSYLTGSRYGDPWWRGRCQSCNQVPATHFARVWQVLDYRIDIAASPMADISRTSKLGQQLGVFLPLLTCSPPAWTSRLQYRRGRKSRSYLWITLYTLCCPEKFNVGYSI